MQMLVTFRTSAAALAVILLLAACARHPGAPVPTPASPALASPVALSQRDLGASMLAAVDNAQEAIDLRDAIAAGNDVGQAYAFSQQMVDRISAILPSEPPNERSGSSLNGSKRLTALLGSLAVRVKLISAQTLLTSANFAGADAELSIVQRQVPNRMLPRDLPLLRAAASLDLARTDASTGIPQIRTQLLCTQTALRAYDEPGHVADAMALASTLGHVLANPSVLRTLLPYQLSLWLSAVTGWAGSPRW